MDALLTMEHNSYLGPRPVPHATSSNASAAAGSSTGSNGPSVTANDFLTLLVTELKNQDPTANTDPNAYVNQLVQVNSLQQLIQINGDLNSTAQGAQNPSQAVSQQS